MLPTLLSRAEVMARLLAIFPQGSPGYSYCTRDMTGAIVFTMLYVGAVEGAARYLKPHQVVAMSDDQAALTSEAERNLYASDSAQGGFVQRGRAWYAENSRETVRDDIIRKGFMPVGAVLDRKDIPTTSPKARYALSAGFAALFEATLTGDALTTAISAWQKTHFSSAALAKLQIVKAGRTKDPNAVTVQFPNGDSRKLKAGPSSIITKHVIEEFAVRFLDEPAVIWVSESGDKVVSVDDQLAKQINLVIDPSKNLPDIILADVGRNEVLLVFVEVVASDGPISESRREELLKLTEPTGIPEERCAFVTAYLERDKHLKKTLPELAWNSFVWLASEPESLIALYGGSAPPPRLHALLRTPPASAPRGSAPP